MVQRWNIQPGVGLGPALIAAAQARGGLIVEDLDAERVVIPSPSAPDASLEALGALWGPFVEAPMAWLHQLSPPKGAKIAVLTERLGCFGLAVAGDRPGQRAALAARNMAALAWARGVAERGVALVLVVVEPEAAPKAVAEGVLARLDELTMATSGSLWSWDGRQLPW